MDNTNILMDAIQRVSNWCKLYNFPEDHGFEHACKVVNNAKLAISQFNLSSENSLNVLLAALLHDIDDRKVIKSINYSGARTILKELDHAYNIGINNTNSVIEMIKLVSCSENGNKTNANIPSWYYIPRDADRIEALKIIGIKRAYDTTVRLAKEKGIEPIFWTDKSPRCKTKEEIERNASPDKLENYLKRGGTSESLIDHMFDKVLHIHHLSSGSTILQKIADEGHAIIVNFVLEFGLTGTIDWNKWI